MAETKATEVAKSQIVAKSKMSRAEKEKAKKDKAKVRAEASLTLRRACFPG